MSNILEIRRTWAGVAALASAVAAAVHFAAATPHFEEWAPAGAFMVASGLAQLAWAAWVTLRTSDEAIVAGVALNSGIVALWVISRTVGIPFGPEAGMAEHVHLTDALATGLEIVVIRAALRIPSPSRPSWMLAAATAAGAALATVAASHEPARERLTALAALLLAFVVHVLIVSIAAKAKGRGRHHEISSHRRARVRIGFAGRSHVGACE